MNNAIEACAVAAVNGTTSTTRRDSVNAAFAQLAELTQQSAWIPFGDALLRARQSATEPTFVLMKAWKDALGFGSEDRAVTAIENTLRTNSQFIPALTLLLQLALHDYSDESLNRAASFLKDSRSSSNDVFESLRILLELARDSVTLAGVRAASLDSGTRASCWVDYARAQLLYRQSANVAATALYAKASICADAALRLLIRRDLSSLVSADETLPDSSYIMDFWAKRSALAGVPIEDRIREHFERLRYARRWYWRHAKTVIPGNVFWSNVLTAAPLKKQGFIVGPELDVRGILFVRRGTPTNVVKTGSGDDNESWYYANPDGTPDFFHFTKSEMAPDFEESDGVPGCDYQYLIDRAQFDSRIGHAVAICAGKMAKDENRLVFIRRQMRFEAQEAARREPILQPHQIIPFSYALYNVRSTEGLQPMLLAALRIPIDELQTKPAGSSFEYAARITISLVDSASGRHLQFDSVYHFITPKGLAANSALRGFAYLPAFTTPSAQYRIRVVDGNDSQRGWVRSGMIAVDPYLAQKQQLSDILLTGAGRSMAGWRRGNVILDVQPAAAVTTDFGIYFEVYNAKSTGLYKVTIRFQNLHRSLLKHTEEFRLSFDEELSAIPPDFWAVSKTLSVALPDGDYALQITLVSPDGSKASQIRNIRIVGSRLTP